MCGICGKLVFNLDSTVDPSLIRDMLATIRHRGPDGEGVYVLPHVGLGHRRLAIIDLNSGDQPLSNEDETVWIVFNGEIYNYKELRDFLLSKGHIFRTKTDTEVIVHLYEEFGANCLEKLRGMFAFALWDEREKTLLLARDRVGIKPLYYILTDRFLVFASEVKAILTDPQVNCEIDPEMIDRFLSFYYTPGEETLFRSILKLPPGFYLLVRRGKAEVKQYWDLRFSRPPDCPDLERTKRELVDLLEEAVRLHMISDVPVGFLLSGGFDSTALVSLAVGKTDHEISSYTVGFSARGIDDERPFARLAADRFGTRHYEMTICAEEFKEFLPRYVWHMEEPVCEPPGIAMYYVSKLAQRHVKVLISGEGGDEAFAGYHNYRYIVWLERLKKVLGPLCEPLRKSLSSVNRVLQSNKLAKYSSLLDVPLDSYYYSMSSTPFRFFNSRVDEFYSRDFSKYVNKEHSVSVARRYLATGAGYDELSKMLYVDTKTWLPDDLLLKADKMTMANSIELRVPFLDHKVLEFAASLPSTYKLRRWTTKYVAKRALHHRVPREILKRRKAGFPVPYESWMRNELRGWVRDILLDRKTLQRGYFRRRSIEDLISKDLEYGVYGKEIFSLVVLELWHRVFLEKEDVYAV